MKLPQLTVGISPYIIKRKELRELSSFKKYIYDLHIPHYNPHISASGRSVNPKISLYEARRKTLDLLSWNQEHTGFKFTLLLNYLLHDNYQVVIDNAVKEFYPRGVHSFVVADLELIKRLKEALPDCQIQGSCLSHRMTEEELEEERQAGVVMHNPSVNIIRKPKQLERNHNAGYPQKIIAFEGCLHNCPDESSLYGHRWYLARSLKQEHYYCKNTAISLDPRYFFKANWVTISRLKTLLPFIDVVKIPRNRKLTAPMAVKKFLHLYETGGSYNIADFISAGYSSLIDKEIGAIPSDLLDNAFFDAVEQCTMDCRERNCRLCYDMMEKIKRVNGGPKRPNRIFQSYRRLRHFARTALDRIR